MTSWADYSLPSASPAAASDPLAGDPGPHHVCDVGSRPREGHSRIRMCRCGTWYCYGGWNERWRPMSRLHLWRHRNDICGLPDGFPDITGG